MTFSVFNRMTALHWFQGFIKSLSADREAIMSLQLCSQATTIIFGSSSIIFSRMPFLFSFSNICLVSLRVCLYLGFFSSNSYPMNNFYEFYFRCKCQRRSLRLPTEDIMLRLHWKFQIYSSLLQIFLTGQPEYHQCQMLSSVPSLFF